MPEPTTRDGDSGFDLFAAIQRPLVIPAQSYRTIPTGIGVEVKYFSFFGTFECQSGAIKQPHQRKARQMVTIEEQIKAVEREINMRRRVYPRWVENKRMSQEKADKEIKAMEAVLETLKKVQQKDRLL